MLPIAVGLAICVVLVHLLVILVVRPAPRTYSLDAITSALGAGMAIRELDVQFAAPPSASQEDDRDRAFGLALADRLSVEPSAVRIVLVKPSRPRDQEGSGAAERGRVPDETRDSVNAIGEMPDQIVGDFTAALRLNDGRWRVVRPRRRCAETCRWSRCQQLTGTRQEIFDRDAADTTSNELQPRTRKGAAAWE